MFPGRSGSLTCTAAAHCPVAEPCSPELSGTPSQPGQLACLLKLIGPVYIECAVCVPTPWPCNSCTPRWDRCRNWPAQRGSTAFISKSKSLSSKQWLWTNARKHTHLMQWVTYRRSLWYRSSWRKVCTRRSSTTDIPFPSSSDSLLSRNCTNLPQHKPSMCNRPKLGSFYNHNKDIKDVLTYPKDLVGHLQHSFARSPQRPWKSNTLHLADAFIQSNLQMRTMTAIKINKRAMICKCYNKSQLAYT